MRDNQSASLSNNMKNIGAIIVVFVGIAIVSGPLVVHIVRCVKDDWVSMLLVGLFIPPVGWVHGVGIIFGVWG